MSVTNSSELLHGLSGSLWPLHLKPKHDELLSSWIIRLAHAHGYKIETLCCLLFGYRSTIWNRDIDRAAPTQICATLSTCTGATFEQIQNATFVSYEGTLFSQVNHHGITRWILPLGIYHRARKRPALMYCPKCLEEDGTPYFRKHWRLAYSTVCTLHQCLLLDTCPKCCAPIAPHRVDMLNRCYAVSIGLNTHCWRCEYDLRHTQAAPVHNSCLIQFQLQLECILQQGYVAWSDNPSLYSVIFFDGLKALITGLTSIQTIKRLSRSGDFEYQRLFENWPTSGLEFADLATRRMLFTWLATLLSAWPERLIALIHQRDLRYSDLKGDSKTRPFWYEKVIMGTSK
jgi:hypothetical protein